MKKITTILTITALLPLMAFAADLVSISGVQTNANGTAITSGNSVYDTAIQTSGSFDDGSVQNSTAANWSFTQTGLRSGEHTFQATNGTASQSLTFRMPSNEGGLRACQIDGTCPNFGLSAPQIPTQNPTKSAVNNRAKDGTLITIFNLFDLLSKGLI